MDQQRFDQDSVVAEHLLQDALEDAAHSLDQGVGHPEEAVTSFDMVNLWALIHPQIAAASKGRFDAKQYADASESAFKAVNSRVKRLWKTTGQEEKDGKALMLSTFSPEQPAVRLADLSTGSGRNIQEGYMHIFAGAIQAIRNPKAHELITITPERAAHFLVLASLLMFKMDEAGADSGGV